MRRMSKERSVKQRERISERELLEDTMDCASS